MNESLIARCGTWIPTGKLTLITFRKDLDSTRQSGGRAVDYSKSTAVRAIVVLRVAGERLLSPSAA
jgi:hypothetical protein